MATAAQNQALNDVLIEVRRSLLQYAAEAWPWASADAPSSDVTIRQLAARQAEHVANLADLLLLCGWTIDFGTYPTEYTDLHYVSLEYFLRLLADSQSVLAAEIAAAVKQAGNDATAAELLNLLLEDQREIAGKLAKLQSAATAAIAK